MSSCDALFLSPHPDDVEIFAGATAAQLAREGHRVRIADLTAGELSSNGTVEGRRKESLAAIECLGVDPERPVLGLPDGALDDRQKDQVAALVELLRTQRPRLLVAPWPQDRHPDHEAAGRLARHAVSLAAESGFGAGSAHRVDRLLFYPCHREVPVDLLVDVAATMELWRAAVHCYGSQFTRSDVDTPTPINRPGFLDSLIARRAHWGAKAKLLFAEAFVHEGPFALDHAAQLLVDRPHSADEGQS